MSTSLLGGIVSPDSTAPAVTHEDLVKIINQIDLQKTMFFTSVADRTTKLATLLALHGKAAPAGAKCYLSTLYRYEWYDGTNWLPEPGTVIKWHRRISDSLLANPAIVGVIRLDNMAVVAGYLYEISVSPISITSNTGDGFEITLRANTAGAAGVGSTAIQTIQDVVDNVASYVQQGISVPYAPAVNENLSVLLCLLRTSGSGSLQIDATATRPLDMSVTFKGRSPGSSGGVDI